MFYNGVRELKRIKYFSLIILLALSLIIISSCGAPEEVKNDIIGAWGCEFSSGDGPCYIFYIFSADGTYEYIFLNDNSPSKNSENNGTYKIKKDKIVLTESKYENKEIIKYTFTDEKLSLESWVGELIYIES